MTRMARGAAAAVPQAGGYVETHYVAPFASVSGATNDDEDMGATAFTNASSALTPTTLGTFCRRATAGNKGRCAAGVYAHPAIPASSHFPGFYFRNSGTLGNEIVLFAATPAATNRGGGSFPGSWSELRWTDPAPDYETVDPTNPIMGSTAAAGGDYCIFDGFAARRTYVPPYASKGAFGVGATGCKYRRMAYYYEGPTDGSLEENYSAFFMQGGTDNIIEDCYINGNYDATGTDAKSSACITMYNEANFTIRNVTFESVHTGIFAKVGTNYGEIANNKVNGASYRALVIYGVAANEVIDAHHNLFIDAGFQDFFGSTPSSHDYILRSNTFINGALVGNNADFVLFYSETAGLIDDPPTPDYVHRDNLIVIDNARTDHILSVEAASIAAPFGNHSVLDYNIHYDATGTASYQYNEGSDSTNLAGYKAAIAGNPAGARETNTAATAVTLDGDYELVDNGQDALTASSTGGRVGHGTEEVGVRSVQPY